jgi:sugar phosphate isomerase/epimerase
LYAVRGECSRDLPATLKAVAGIGYAGVEPYGYGGESLSWLGHEAGEIRRMLDDLGLICCGIHLRTDALLGDNLARTIEFNRVLGNTFLIVAGDQARMQTQGGIAELADILNDTAAKLSEHDMFTGYHAHPFDAVDVDGTPAWFRLFAQVDPAVVMQMDVGNYFAGGGDPVAAMLKFPKRARTVHVKDRNAPEVGMIGQGEAPVTEFLKLCREFHDTEWYVIEECAPDGLGFDVVTRAYSALVKLMK